jgi:hypothetical protein
VIGWLDRGIDLTDEGYCLLGYRHPHDVYLTLSHFHHLVAALTGHRAWPVLFYRVLGLVVAIGPAAFFALQLHRTVTPAGAAPARSRMLALAAFTTLGGLACYTVGPRSLSYNGLSNACMLIEAGLTLVLISARAATGARRLTAALALGIVLAAHLAIKSTSAALMAAWILASIAALAPNGRRVPLASTTALGGTLGAAIFAAAFFGLIEPFRGWWTGLSITRDAMRAIYSPAALAESSLAPLIRQLEIAGPITLQSLGVAAAGAWFASRGRRWLGVGLISLGSLIMISVTLEGAIFPAGSRLKAHAGTLFTMLVALSMMLWLWARGRRESALAGNPTPGRTRLWALLLALPLLSALGSNNALSIQVQIHLAPWFAVLWLASEEMPAGPGRIWSDLAAVSAGLIAVFLIARSQLATPYRIAGGIWAQTERFSPRIEAGRGLRVDSGTRELVESTRDLLDRNGFQPGDPLLFFYDLPGLVYLAGGRSSMLPWFFSGSDSLACRAIRLSSEEIRRGRVFVLARGQLSAPVVASLAEAGMRTDVRMLGTIRSHYYGEIHVLEHAPGNGP